MRNWSVRYTLVIVAVLTTSTVLGQPSAGDDLDTLRTLTKFGGTDQRLIGEWIDKQFKQLASELSSGDKDDDSSDDMGEAVFVKFRGIFNAQYKNSKNTSQFQTEFASQLGQAAIQQFGKHGKQPWIENTISRVLLDMARIETLDGLLAGFKSTSQATRYYCAQALADLGDTIAADQTMLDKVVDSLRQAGVAESNAVVLSRIYLALAYGPSHLGKVFDVYDAIFESRLTRRRSGARVVDYGEIDAFEFLRSSSVIAALTQPQKVKLAILVGTFMRMDAERLGTGMVKQHEIEAIMRRLDGEEAILAGLVGNSGRGIRDALGQGGFGNRAAIMSAVYAWVGDPKAKSPGTLNAAPWNGPIGLP